MAVSVGRIINFALSILFADLCTGSQAFVGVYQIEIEGASAASEVIVYDSACYACSYTGPACAQKTVRTDTRSRCAKRSFVIHTAVISLTARREIHS